MASKKVFGSAEIRANGRLYLTLPGATLDPGGVSRATVEGDNTVHGYSVKPRAAKLECEISLREGESVTDINKIDDATVTFRAVATGQVWVMRNAWSDGESTITSAPEGGKVKVVFGGVPAEEML